MLDRQFLEYLEGVKLYSPHTIQAYQNDLRQFSAFVSSHFHFDPFRDAANLQKVNASICRAFFAYARGKKTTLQRKKSSLARFFKYQIQLKNINHSPIPCLSFQGGDKKVPSVALEKEINLLLDQMQSLTTFEAVRDWCIFEVLYGCGLRRSELIAIQLEDVDIKNRLLLVKGKGKKQRLQPFNFTVAKALQAYIEVCRREGYDLSKAFFLTSKGEPLYPKFVYRTVKKYLTPLSYLERRSPHILRHTFATHLLNRGADLLAVKELLGHANIKSTERYLRSSIQRLREVYKNAHPRAE
ncbi:MAG: tyrosine-type recombinase/integrase [Bacteroidia bacterium]|nr:tyrosine-type recombinase/integrase [Bacteroidia bacterium]MDW8158536.1 tyrosine-type recombinase/integrase [Bacteroidia bacterium]